MDRKRLIDEIADLATQMASTHARILEKVAEADDAKEWVHDGATSCAAWLVAHLGIAHSTARSWTKTAMALADLPATNAAYEGGNLSYDQVKTVCRFATPDTDSDVADTARWMSVAQLGRIARQHDLVNLDTLDEAYQRRHFRWRHDEARHTMFFDGQLPDDRGSVVVQALERIGQSTPHDPDVGMYDGFGPRAADALYAMASQSLGADADPDRATVVVHIDAGVLTDSIAGNGASQGGPALHAETVKRLACDGRIQFVADAADGTPIGIGRTSRQIPAWLARQVALRDQGCRFPGCHFQRWVQIHHIIHWSRGGATDLDNLITLCGFHHRLVHERGWRISGDPNGEVAWIRPSGVVYRSTIIERDLANLALMWRNIGVRPVRGTATADTS